MSSIARMRTDVTSTPLSVRSGERRRCRLRARLSPSTAAGGGKVDLARCFDALRDHGSDGGALNKWAPRAQSVCAHAAAGPLRSCTQTTSSCVIELRRRRPPLVWATGASAPCIGIFKPLFVDALSEGLLRDEAIFGASVLRDSARPLAHRRLRFVGRCHRRRRRELLVETRAFCELPDDRTEFTAIGIDASLVSAAVQFSSASCAHNVVLGATLSLISLSSDDCPAAARTVAQGDVCSNALGLTRGADLQLERKLIVDTHALLDAPVATRTSHMRSGASVELSDALSDAATTAFGLAADAMEEQLGVVLLLWDQQAKLPFWRRFLAVPCVALVGLGRSCRLTSFNRPHFEFFWHCTSRAAHMQSPPSLVSIWTFPLVCSIVLLVVALLVMIL